MTGRKAKAPAREAEGPRAGAGARRRSSLSTVVAALAFAAGLVILFYPTVSDLWNQWRQNSLMASYDEAVADAGGDDNEAALAAAEAYNAALDPSLRDAFAGDDPAAGDVYWSLLDPLGQGIMGCVQIPKIGVRLPVYHGTGEKGLAQGLGHLAGTSLPVGGTGTHCVLAGHRGLPSALLLTDLDQLAVGDRFTVTVLGRRMAYEVDRVLVVEPDDVSSLRIEAGQDYVSLVTCTPYGVNTQRLIVRGHRVEWADEPQVGVADQVAASLGWRSKLLIALAALAVAAVIVALLRRRGAPRKGRHFS